MVRRSRSNAEDLAGAAQLAVQSTTGMADVVQAMHRAIAGPLLSGPFAPLAYAGVRGITRLVGAGAKVALSRLGRLLGQSESGPQREALLAVLNGVVGDTLKETGNPLAIQMRLRHLSLIHI